jgi:hypothetical protein
VERPRQAIWLYVLLSLHLSDQVRTRRVKVLTLTSLNWQAYLEQLQSNPMRTKMLTSGTLSALQEFLASWIAHDRSKHGHYINSRVPKMAIYGAFISAPLGHFLVTMLQKIFAGRTSLKAKILQIVVSNLVVCSPFLLCHLCHANEMANQPVDTDQTPPSVDFPNPELGLPDLHGHHCWSAYLPPSSRYR